MLQLFIVSLIWAFSFGLIKGGVSDLDSAFVSFARLSIAMLCFLPFFRRVPMAVALKLLGIGAVQFGLMYLFYIRAFQSLQAYQIALLTIFTPLWVTFLNDLHEREFHPKFWLTVILATIGVGCISYKELGTTAWSGILLVQLSNACFAGGQLAYKRLMQGPAGTLSDTTATAYMYIGGAAVGLCVSLSLTPWTQTLSALTVRHALILFYLGAIASGLCFLLWNIGTRKVNIGILAIMNNLKIPLAVAVSLLVFGEQTNLPRLILGALIIAGALWLNENLPDFSGRCRQSVKR